MWHQEEIINYAGEAMARIDVCDLPEGVYILRVATGTTVLTRKLVVAR